MREDSPALDFLLVISTTFGQPLGFAPGVADFVFLAFFATIARRLPRGSIPTLALGCAAMLAGLLLETYLPALPFMVLSFVLASADLTLTHLQRTRNQGPPASAPYAGVTGVKVY